MYALEMALQQAVRSPETYQDDSENQSSQDIPQKMLNDQLLNFDLNYYGVTIAKYRASGETIFFNPFDMESSCDPEEDENCVISVDVDFRSQGVAPNHTMHVAYRIGVAENFRSNFPTISPLGKQDYTSFEYPEDYDVQVPTNIFREPDASDTCDMASNEWHVRGFDSSTGTIHCALLDPTTSCGTNQFPKGVTYNGTTWSVQCETFRSVDCPEGGYVLSKLNPSHLDPRIDAASALPAERSICVAATKENFTYDSAFKEGACPSPISANSSLTYNLVGGNCELAVSSETDASLMEGGSAITFVDDGGSP